MIPFEDVYQSRKEEISKFIRMMRFIEQKEFEKDDEGNTAFDYFFCPPTGGIDLTYQQLINIFKSNLSLMLYNIIEYTVANLIDSIYDEIRIQKLSYIDVNESIKQLWKRTILKAVNDPSANFKTFLKKNDEIIDYIIERRTLSLNSRDSLPAGNLDGYKIKETFDNHGVQVSSRSQYFRPDVFENIKQKRNDLAHGTVSFVEAVHNDSLADLESKTNIIFGFLDELMETVKKYIETREYMVVIA